MTREELRAELAPSLEELRAIRKVFEVEGQTPPPEGPECPHPEEKRVSLTATKGPIEWICGVKDCGYHHVEPRE